ncbi:MAG: delta-60 repeat domain-containing protein [Planctomycetes bacterium]|nr:delta-60 repeat domain-containing protein [Planctomycetota bacterium]
MALSLSAFTLGIARSSAFVDGSLDPTFNLADQANLGGGASGLVNAVAVQPDGKVLIVGVFQSYGGVTRGRVARLNAAGGLDYSFAQGAGANFHLNSVALQSDGKVLIAGEFSAYDGVARAGIARLNADGSLDTSFNPGAGAGGPVSTVVVQPDGKVLIGGNFMSYDGITRRRIARINTDGSLDLSFDTGAGVNGNISANVYAIALQHDGKVVVAGAFLSVNGTPRRSIARLNADGSLDTSFDPGTGPSGPQVRALAVQPDGRLIIGGNFSAYNGTARVNLARVNSNGSLDTSFDAGAGPSSPLMALALQPDGKLVIGGDFTSYGGFTIKSVARVHADGNLDTSFDPGSGPSTAVLGLALQPDGKILLGGDFFTYNGFVRRFIARANSDGSVDTTFNIASGVAGTLRALVLQPDGKALISGTIFSYNDVPRSSVVRVNVDGSLDPSFDAGTGIAGHNSVVASALALQPDGKVVVGGDFWTFNGTPYRHLVRLNSDGSVDTSFATGTGAGALVEAVAVQPDGKVLVAGSFGLFNGQPRGCIARLNSDGSLDSSFGLGGGANMTVRALALQSDGKVLIGGEFNEVGGIFRSRIARLNANGDLDTSFDPGAGTNNDVWSIAVQPDGKVLIGGVFTMYNLTTRRRLARLNPDGSLDSSFVIGTGANNLVSTFAVQPDGKVLVGGWFTLFNGAPCNYLARLDANGSRDMSFGLGSGPDNWVWSLALQADSKLWVGGSFKSYDATTRTGLARVYTVAPGVTTSYCTSGTSAIGCTPTMSASGVASAAATNGYFVTTSNIEGQRQTNTFYSLLGPKTPATPFGAGLLCVKAPTQRIGSVQASGTPGLCDGTVSIDVLAWAQSHPNGQGVPYTAGTTLNFQCAIRDPLSPGTRVMSDALQVTLLP